MIDGIRSAREVVLVASFLLSDHKITEALLSLADDVRLYVLTASEIHLTKVLQDDSHFDQQRIDEHRALLDRLAQRGVVRTASHFHAKFLVVDPHSAPRGWISTANFNPALTDSVELGVELKTADAEALAGWFNRIFWSEADHELRKAGALQPVNPSPVCPPKPGPSSIVVTAHDEFSIALSVLKIIEQSTGSLLVSSYGLELNHRVVNALIDRLHKNVKVTVFTRPRVAVAAAVSALANAGATVIAHEKLHAKAIWGDAGALVMSANLETHGMDRSFEVGVVLNAKQSGQLKAVLLQWEQWFSWRYSETTRRGEFCGRLLLANEPPKTRSRTVVEKVIMTLDAVVAANATELEHTPPPARKHVGDAKVLPQSIEFQWAVHAPVLPKGATEILRAAKEAPLRSKDKKPTNKSVGTSYHPSLYQQGAQHYVVVRAESEFLAAKLLADEFNAKIVVAP
jgi:cardiolipin synthase